MTSRQPKKTSRLTDMLGRSGTTTTWTDDAGATWTLTAHWALIDGRATMVGLDIRCPDDRLAELTQRVLRGIPISRIRETTRERAAAEALRQAESLGRPADPGTYRLPGFEMWAAHWAGVAEAYTTKGEPRKRLPAAGEEILTEVARMYIAAVAAGDKTPARSIEAELRSAGFPVSERGGRDQVRKWIQRARQRGLIPPVREGK